MGLKDLLQAISGSIGTDPYTSQEVGTTQPKMGRVVPDPSRCVQCGVCGYNCPVGIPVRDYAHRGLPVTDSSCITCGQCIQACPRGTLRWETQVHTLIANRFLSVPNTQQS